MELQQVNVGHKALADYATIATRGLMEEIRRLAEPLRGKRQLEAPAPVRELEAVEQLKPQQRSGRLVRQDVPPSSRRIGAGPTSVLLRWRGRVNAGVTTW